MFSGQSFLQYPGLQRNTLSFTEIEIVFKPMDVDGLILYNGFSRDRTGDFIDLAMKDGYVEYRFDLGTGAAYIRFERLGMRLRGETRRGRGTWRRSVLFNETVNRWQLSVMNRVIRHGKDRETYRETGRPTDTQTGRQADSYVVNW